MSGNCPIKDLVTCHGEKPFPRSESDPNVVLAGYVDCDGEDITPCSEIPRCPEYSDGTEVPSDGNGHPVINRVRVANLSGRPLYPVDGTHSPDQMIGLSRSDGQPAEFDPDTGIWQQQGIRTPDGVPYPFGTAGDQLIGINPDDATFNPETGEWDINIPDSTPPYYCRLGGTDIIDLNPRPAGYVVTTPTETLTNPSSTYEMCVLFDATVQAGIYLNAGDQGFIQPYIILDGASTPAWGQEGVGPASGALTHGDTISFSASVTLPPGGSVDFALAATVVGDPSIDFYEPMSLNIRALGVNGAA